MSPRIPPGFFASVRAHALGTLLVCSAAGACRAVGVSSTRSAPVLRAVTPASLCMKDGVPAALGVRGAGFVRDSNAVEFGSWTFPGIRADSNGTFLHVRIPDRPPSRTGAAPMLWVGGTYSLLVSNRNGRSNALPVVVCSAP